MMYSKNLLYGIVALLLSSVPIWVMYSEYGQLIPFMGYMVLSTSFLALPHEPVVVYYATLYGALIPALLAIIPTLVGSLLDYRILSPLLNHSALKKYKSKLWYRKILHYFTLLPFTTIFFCALTPVPFYPVRLLSILSGYPPLKYSLAVIFGRIPRFIFMALGGKLLNLDNKLIILIFIVFILVYISGLIYKKYSRIEYINF